jgi:5-methylcytosine-specific restriction endonuclease McrA
MSDCGFCSQPIIGKQKSAKWCSEKCRKSNQRSQPATQERERLYRAKIAPTASAYHKQYLLNNKTQIQKRQSEWYLANKAHVTEMRREYRKNNPEAISKFSADRRARKKNAPTIEFTADELFQRFAYFGHCCWICGTEAVPMTADHVKPLSKGGWHCLSNIRPACKSCNSRKRDKWPINISLGSIRVGLAA